MKKIIRVSAPSNTPNEILRFIAYNDLGKMTPLSCIESIKERIKYNHIAEYKNLFLTVEIKLSKFEFEKGINI